MKRWVALFVAALLLRAGVVMFVPADLRVPRGDADDYHQIALNVAAGNGYTYPYVLRPGELRRPDTTRAPGYTFFLAGVYWMAGPNLTAARLANALLGALTCVLVGLLGATLFNPVVGLVTAVLAASYWPFIYYWSNGGPAVLLSENLFLPALSGAALAYVHAFRSGSAVAYSALGMTLGVAALTRPEAVLITAVMAGLLAGAKRLRTAGFVALVLAFVLVVAPWTVRNYRVTGRLVPITSLGGASFYFGNNPYVNGGYLTNDPPEIAARVQSLSPVERDRLLFREGVTYLAQHPGRIPSLFLKKVLIFWAPFAGRTRFNYMYAWILLPALVGCVQVWRRRRLDPSPLVLPAIFLFYTLLTMAMYGDVRYRYALEPFLILLSVCAGWYAWHHPRRIHLVIAFGVWIAFTTVLGLMWPSILAHGGEVLSAID